MNAPAGSLLLVAMVSLPVATCAVAGSAPDVSTVTPADTPAARKSAWIFNLLPKAFQKNPILDMTVFTEVTAAGRSLTPPTQDHPVYFESFAPGYRQEGGSIREHPPAPAELLEALNSSLQTAGYRPATPEHPPTLLLIEHWGSHNRLDSVVAAINPDLAVRNIIARARLIGGNAFARTLLRAYHDDINAGPLMLPVASQLNRLRHSSPTMRFLVDQTHEDVYFVVASAYDWKSAADDQPVLLWRTSMTANTRGVSMKQTLPSLIEIATPFFGRETTEAMVLRQRGLPEGKVELGELQFIGVLEDTPFPEDTGPPAEAPKPAGP